MHRFHSRRSLIRLRFGSLLYLLFSFSIIALFPAIIWVVFLDHKEDQLLPLIILGTAMISGIICLIVSTGVRCPLCHGPLLSNPGCSRSNKARKIFGSHRLGVAVYVLLFKHFRCPCCGEPCRCTTARR